MLQRIRDYFREASTKPPSEPARSTFGAGASQEQNERDRADNWEKEVAIQKGRVKGF